MDHKDTDKHPEKAGVYQAPTKTRSFMAKDSLLGGLHGAGREEYKTMTQDEIQKTAITFLKHQLEKMSVQILYDTAKKVALNWEIEQLKKPHPTCDTCKHQLFNTPRKNPHSCKQENISIDGKFLPLDYCSAHELMGEEES